MRCSFDPKNAEGYHSSPQRIRNLTETWASDNLYCPRCGNPRILHFPNNRAVADFFCPDCKNEYELKSKNGAIGRKITDGAYETFIQRITSNRNPDFLFLSYSAAELCVENLWLVPKHFFVPDIVEKRKPLSENARRAGWVGCNILFDQIPVQGRISIVRDRTPVEKNVVLSQVRHSDALSTDNLEARGWLLDVLTCINRIPNEVFTLAEAYRFDEYLQQKHPNNHNTRPKLRQQLQVLRDKGYLEFLGRGVYRKLQ